jgi:hypothetical protein
MNLPVGLLGEMDEVLKEENREQRRQAAKARARRH